jgi:hypothetical protein
VLADAPAATVGVTQVLTASVTPVDAQPPITYTWEVEEAGTFTQTAGVSDSLTVIWTQPGAKNVRVTAANASGAVDDSRSIQVMPGKVEGQEPVPAMFLPLIIR